MADPTILTITDGVLALSVVDEGASSYSAAWQAPAGATAATAALAAYTDADAAWSCQITSGRLVASANVTRRDRAATFCSPASSTPTPQQTTYTLDATFFQDADIRDGLQSFLYEHDTEEAYFLLGLRAGTAPPRAIGRVVLASVGFGGEPQVDLTDTFSLSVLRRPDILFGSTGSTRLITGTGTVTNTPA